MLTEKKIKLETLEEEVAVRKMPIGKYAEVFGILEELPNQLNQLESVSKENLLRVFPKIVAKSLPEVLHVLSIATDLPLEKINKLGLDEIVELFATVLEVNKFDKIVERIKKALASLNPPKVTKELTGQTGSVPS